MTPLLVRRLGPQEADAAFALARLDDPSLTPAVWRGAVDGDPAVSGVFAAFTDGAPRGVLRYAVMESDGEGALLVIEGLAAFDLIDPEPVATALITHAMVAVGHDRDGLGIGFSAALIARRGEPLLDVIPAAATLHRIL